MTDRLGLLLPVHALRERRALRRCHEAATAHDRACRDHLDAIAVQAAFTTEALATRTALAGSASHGAGHAHWALCCADDLDRRALACAPTVAAMLAARTDAADTWRSAREAHAACVRGHVKLREAAERHRCRASRALTARHDTRGDDDFAPRWHVRDREEAST